MCPSIINEYIKMINFFSNVFLIEFVVDHDMVNVNKKKHIFHIIHYVDYNEHCDLENFYEE